MSDGFNPYYTWLGIPPEEQPPDHYRLLGVRQFEANREVIANASDQRMTHLRTFQNGKRAAESQKLLNEVAAATRNLLDPALRTKYDADLRARLAAQVPAAIPVIPLPLATMPQAMPLPTAAPPYHPFAPTYPPAPQPVLAPFVAPLAIRSQSRKPVSQANVLVLFCGGIAATVLLGGAMGIAWAVLGPQPPEVAVTTTITPSAKPLDSPSVSRPIPKPELPVVNTSPPQVKPAVPADDKRILWIYTNASAGNGLEGAVRLVGNGHWEERNKTGAHYLFDEVKRSASRVELYDKQRPMWVHLYNDRLEYSRDGNRFVRGQSGGWSGHAAPTPPPQLAVGLSRNLLDFDWNALRYGGNFTKLDTGWRSVGQPGDPDKLEFPFEAPAEYTLEATFVRRAGSDSLVFLVVCGGRQGALVLNGFEAQGFYSGLQLIDGRQLTSLQDPRPIKGPIIESGKEYKFHCEVKADRITARLEDRELVDWKGPFTRLAPDPFLRSPRATRLGLATWGSSYEIKRLHLTPQKLSPASIAPPKTSVQTPGGGTANPGASPIAPNQRQLLSFNGEGGLVEFNLSTPLIEFDKPFTLEFWIRCRPDHPTVTLIDAEGLRLKFNRDTTGTMKRVELVADVSGTPLKGLVADPGTAWHHVSLCGDGKMLQLHFDGGNVTAAKVPAGAAPVSRLVVGQAKDRSDPFYGELAELRLSTARRYFDNRFTPAPFSNDDATRFFAFFSLKGMEVQFSKAGPVNHGLGGAGFLGGDSSFPPAVGE